MRLTFTPQWYEDHRPLFTVCLTHIKNILANINRVYGSLSDPEGNDARPLPKVLIILIDKEDLERVLAVTWAMFSPYLMEDNAYVKKNIYKELGSLLSTLQVRLLFSH